LVQKELSIGGIHEKERYILWPSVTFLVILYFSMTVMAQDIVILSRPSLSTKRLSSTGDRSRKLSTLSCPWQSLGKLVRLYDFGNGCSLDDVYSHNQRITKNFGSRGRKNLWRHGGDMPISRVRRSSAPSAHYVTVLMGTMMSE
jgi:hypothetical protein